MALSDSPHLLNLISYYTLQELSPPAHPLLPGNVVHFTMTLKNQKPKQKPLLKES